MASNFSLWNKVWSLLTLEERRNSAQLIGLMFVGMVLEMLGIGLVIPVIGLLLHPDMAGSIFILRPFSSTIKTLDESSLITISMLVLVGAYTAKSLFLAFLAWYESRFAYKVQEQLSQRLLTSYVYQPYTYHLTHNSSQLIRNITGEVQAFTFNVMIPGLQLMSESLVFVGLLGLMLFIEPLGSIMTITLMGLATLGFHRLTRTHILRWGKARQLNEGLRIQHLQQALGGIKDLKLMGLESYFLGRYSRHNTECAQVGEKITTLKQLPRLWLELLAVVGISILILVMVGQGRELQAVIPTLGLFVAAAFRLMPSANRMLGAIQSIRYGLPVVDLLHEELKLHSLVPDADSETTATFNTYLELRSVSYTYPGNELPTLKALSIVINRGESIGFIGPSGAGKSTLVDLLLGLLVPDEDGTVCVDGIDIHKTLRGWQNMIGYVPQHIYLTDDTLRHNIAFGISDLDIDEQALLKATEMAQLQELVASLPSGLDSQVGERGVRLSGGQRQRIGIARALYHSPDILVLDEATSALDHDTEREVMDAVRSLHGNKTVIIVAHRLSTVEHCDRLYYLKDGEVTAKGAPKDILATIG